MCAQMKQRRLSQSFKDQDGIQIMKDSMASGFFARDRDSVVASASMVFVGNINQSVDTLVKTSHFLTPFPEVMIDTAFLIVSMSIFQAGKYQKCGQSFASGSIDWLF